MRVPYTPVALWPELQSEVNAYYAAHGVETELATEEQGYILKVYVKGKHIGGLQQLADALKITG